MEANLRSFYCKSRPVSVARRRSMGARKPAELSLDSRVRRSPKRGSCGASEFANSRVVFDARRLLHAASYIDPIGPHGANRGSDIFRVEAAGENQPHVV